MRNGRRAKEFASRRVGASACRPEGERHAVEVGCTHILVPTSLALTDRAALRLGFELAVLHRATVTVLHVVPGCEFRRAAQGLEAIGLLHQAAFVLHAPSASRSGDSLAAARREIGEFLECVIPRRLSEAVNVHIECRTGDVAERIARLAEEADADLVILSSRAPRWWRPFLAPVVRRVLQLTRRQVLLATRNAKAHGRLPF